MQDTSKKEEQSSGTNYARYLKRNSEQSQQYCITYIKVAKKLDLQCAHHRKEMIIRWQGRGVS